MVNRHSHFGGTRWLHLWYLIKELVKNTTNTSSYSETHLPNPDYSQSHQDLQRLFYHTSHNLKGPVSRLNGLIELLLLDKSAGNSQQYIGKIDREVKHMNKMLAKLQTINDINMLGEEMQLCNLDKVIHRVLKKHEKLISEKNIFIRIHAAKEYSLLSREPLLFWLLDNLVENAIMFSRADSEEQSCLEISLQQQEGTLYLRLEDNGEGIRRESQNQVFELFFRDSLQSVGGGIGLYIVRECVKKLNGSISLQSEPGRYTRVEVALSDGKNEAGDTRSKQKKLTHKV